MRILKIAVLAAVVMFFFFCANTQAEMARVIVNCWTDNFTDTAQRQMGINVEVYDSTYLDPPSLVKQISVKAPDGSVLSIHPTNNWLHTNGVYYKGFYASDFKYGKIPGGTYHVTVTPFSGSAITESDSVIATFLPVASINSPVNDETVGATPTFRWTAVSGATHYRLRLWNNTRNEPVFWYYNRILTTDFNTVTMPPGALKPNCTYQLRIEARSGSQDLDLRSQSDWVTFKTGSW